MEGWRRDGVKERREIEFKCWRDIGEAVLQGKR